MNKKNDFDNRKNRPELDEYVIREIMQYYGEDVINNINSSAPPQPPKLKRKSKILSALGICCAVMFLTGAMIFSGVLFTLGIQNNMNDSESDINSVSSSDMTDNDNTSHENESKIFDSNSESDIANNTDTSALTDSETKADSEPSEKKHTDTASESSPESTDTSDDDTESRPAYYSLPEYPYEGDVSGLDTDANNNSATNPYDNVTTGKRVRAGIGITLMALSLAITLAINKFKYNSD